MVPYLPSTFCPRLISPSRRQQRPATATFSRKSMLRRKRQLACTRGHPQQEQHNFSHRLPFDILANVLDYHRPRYDDGAWSASLAAFSTLALINSDAHAIVASGLYRHVVLEGMGAYGDDHAGISQRCCRTISQNSTIAALVQKCTIVYLAQEDDTDPDVHTLADSLRRMVNLRCLELRDFSIPVSIVHALCSLRNLESLSLKGCDLPDSAFPVPRPLFSLQEFIVSDSSLSEPEGLLSAFVDPTTLRTLEMDTECTEAALKCLPWDRLASLKKLYAEPTHDSGSHFCDSLSHLSSLEDLGFAQSYTSPPFDTLDFKLSPLALPSLTRYMGPGALASTFATGRPIDTVVLDQKKDSRGIRPRNLFSTAEHRSDSVRSTLAAVSRSQVVTKSVDLVVAKIDAELIAMIAKHFPLIRSLRLTSLDETPSLYTLQSLAEHLKFLPSLRSLELCASSQSPAADCTPISLTQQRELLHTYQSICPDLRHVAFMDWLAWHPVSETDAWLPTAKREEDAWSLMCTWASAAKLLDNEETPSSLFDWQGYLAGFFGSRVPTMSPSLRRFLGLGVSGDNSLDDHKYDSPSKFSVC